MSFIGYTFEPEDRGTIGTFSESNKPSKRTHDKAIQYSERVERNTTTASTGSNIGNGENWISHGGPYTTYAATEGWGDVSISGHLYNYKESELKDGKELWAQVHTYRIDTLPDNGIGKRTPEDVEIRQNWSEAHANITVPFIDKIHPSGDLNGEKYVNSGIGINEDGGELSWGYSQSVPDISLEDSTDDSGNEHDAVWEYEFNNSDNEELQVTNGSRMWFNSDSYPVESDMGTTEATGHFDGPYTWGGEWVTATINWRKKLSNWG